MQQIRSVQVCAGIDGFCGKRSLGNYFDGRRAGVTTKVATLIRFEEDGEGTN